MANNDRIDIHRLTTGTLIRVAGTTDAARVTAIRFDGEGYGIDLRYGQSDEGYEEYMYVEADGSVEFEGVGEPVLRDIGAVTFDEWAAANAVRGAAVDRAMAEMPPLSEVA